MQDKFLKICIIFFVILLVSGCTENKASSEKTSSEKSVDFVEIGPYEMASHPILINGKLAFWAEVEEYYRLRVVYDGKPVTAYSSTGPPVNIGEKLAFWTFQEGEGVGIVYDGQVIGKDSAIYKQSLLDVGGKLAYKIRKDEKDVIVYDGQELETKYDSVGGLMVVDGKLTYTASKDGKWYIVHGSDEIETQYAPAYPVKIGGKFAYVAQKDNKAFVVFEGKEGHPYDRIKNLIDVGGKPAYVVEDDGAFFVVYNGVEGPRYFRVYKLVEVGGKPAYSASNMYDEKFIVIGDQAYQYDDVRGPAIIYGKLVFAAKENGRWFIYYDGEIIETRYKGIYGFEEVGGKLGFSAEKSDGWYIVIKR